MYLIVIGALLIGLKALALGPVAEWSWWWVLSPLAVAFVWFEFLEKPLGFDRRKVEHLEIEKRRKERVAAQFPAPMGTGKPR
jgi:small Trp-rich protein